MADDQQFDPDGAAPSEENGVEQVHAGSFASSTAGVSGSGVPSPATSEEREASGLVNGGDDAAPSDSLSRLISGTPNDEAEEDDAEESILPRQPRTLLDLGLSKAFLTDLVLKIIHYSGTPSMVQLARRLGLGPTIVQHLISALQEEHLLEVLSQSDLYTGNYRFRLSTRGQQRAAEALDRSRYAGPAPVTAEQYGEVIRKAQASPQDMGRGRIKAILNELVLSGETADAVARVLFSGKAGLLFGPSGNGKTSILERFATDLDGYAVVPYAIYAYGQVIRVFDQSIHQSLENVGDENTMKEDKFDRRWVMVRRPAIVLGAEFGRETLDLAYDPQSRFYQAPPHIKVQGGLLVVDDFGRQKIDAREILTRWLIPLERGWDTLSLVSGEKVTVPFNMQVLFGTNLRTKDLADDALLRRILYKVEIPNPRPQEFQEILRKLCHQKHVLVADGALESVVDKLFNEPRIKPHAAHARDLLDILIESASFDGRDPVLDGDSFARVFKLFVAQESEEEPATGY
jgi:DNA-binding MarR family transcriptional regulator